MKNISSFIMPQDKLALKNKLWQEQVELEMDLEYELTQIMRKYGLIESQEEIYHK